MNFLHDAHLGDIVYNSYRPQRLGKITHLKIKQEYPNAYNIYDCTVHWTDGTESVESNYHLKRLTDLIQDHEQKIQTHKNALAKAQETLKDVGV